ncbi:hypothetical protein [Pseudomonas carnis]|uniref:hypothetical protein n=1 Tax=Pseudomonas carnis TaxID=2487355 RepID=UPI001BC9D867|nr:hypothetical protein [Pseudomonas carnis]
MNSNDRAITERAAQLMVDASLFMQTVSGLIVDNLVEQEDGEGRPFMTGFRVDGLMRGLALVSDALSDRGEWLSLTVKQEEQREEEENKAALARRSGKKTLVGTNAGEQS